MNESNKSLLAQKKRQLQLHIVVTSWLPQWLSVFEAIKALNKPWRFEYFDCAKAEDRVHWEKNLLKPPLAGLGISLADIKTPDNYYVHRRMEDHFPSKLQMRYMPTLAHHVPYENSAAAILEKAATVLQIHAEEEVYLFFTRFTPVFCLPFSSISLLKLDDVISREDLCIMHPDFRWLIFRSLEDEWTWGKEIIKQKI